MLLLKPISTYFFIKSSKTLPFLDEVMDGGERASEWTQSLMRSYLK